MEVGEKPRVSLVGERRSGGAVLRCTVAGWPRPKVEWRRDGVVTRGRGEVQGEEVQGRVEVHTLEVGEGTYSCHATNTQGNSMGEVEVVEQVTGHLGPNGIPFD